MKKLSVLSVGILFVLGAFAQDAKKFMKQGNSDLEYEQYRKAIVSFKKVLEVEPENATALFKIGHCYLETFEHQKGLESMQAAIEIDAEVDKYQDYWLGRAYHLNYMFDEAINHYQLYLSTIKSKGDTRRDDLEKFLEECGYAKGYLAQPSHYRIENIGGPINTPDLEHSPVVSQDGKMMMFTSRHYIANGGDENHDDFIEQILISRKGTDGKWGAPQHFEHNLNGHDATIQLFDEDSKLLMYRNSGSGDLFVSEFTGDFWTEPEPYPGVNTQWNEVDGYINVTGDVFIYASSFRANDHDGTTDLFVIRRDESGKWSEPESVGDNINTKYEEKAPFLSSDGKTLYFSSTGHSSMGGYDVFKSYYDEDKEAWSDPINLGYPLNTPSDDIYFYYSNENNWSGYFSSYRRDGMGENDIYEVTFVPNVYVKGTVTDKNTGDPAENVQIDFVAVGEDETTASTPSEEATGKYLVNVVADEIYSVLVKNEAGVTLGTFEYEIPLLKEGDPLEYEFDMEVNMAVPELITENYEQATPEDEQTSAIVSDDEPMSENDIVESNQVTYDEKGNPIENIEETQVLAEKSVSSTHPVSNAPQSESFSASPESDDNYKGPSYVNEKYTEENKVDVKTYFKMEDVESGCKRILHHVYFDFNKSTLKEISYEELQKLSCLMSTHPSIVVEISGHTDALGNDDYNKKLSHKRAKAVVNYLVQQGVQASRLMAIGYGEDRPLASNDDEEEGRELNRRTEFKIIDSSLSMID